MVVSLQTVSPKNCTLTWWKGLCDPVILGALMSGSIAPGWVSQGKLISGDEADEEWFKDPDEFGCFWSMKPRPKQWELRPALELDLVQELASVQRWGSRVARVRGARLERGYSAPSWVLLCWRSPYLNKRVASIWGQVPKGKVLTGVYACSSREYHSFWESIRYALQRVPSGDFMALQHCHGQR